MSINGVPFQTSDYPLRIRTGVIFGLALSLFSIQTVPLSGQSSDKMLDRCTEEKNPDLVLDYCSKFINSRQPSSANLAIAFHSRGVAYFREKDYDRAIQDYDQAIRLAPSYAAAFLDRGKAYKDKKDYDRAILDYDEAIRLDPNYAAAFNNRCYTFREKKDYDRAMRDCDQGIRLALTRLVDICRKEARDDPSQLVPVEIETVISYLGLQKANGSLFAAQVGFSDYKNKIDRALNVNPDHNRREVVLMKTKGDNTWFYYADTSGKLKYAVWMDANGEDHRIEAKDANDFSGEIEVWTTLEEHYDGVFKKQKGR